jgi:hypothetical protein
MKPEKKINHTKEFKKIKVKIKIIIRGKKNSIGGLN